MPITPDIDPNRDPSYRSRLIAIVVIILVLVGIAWVAFMRRPGSDSALLEQNKPSHSDQSGQSNEIVKTEVDTATLPEKIPTDLPVEAGAKVIDNYNASTSDGSIQSTRVFETQKTLDENFALYSNYFKENGWTITNSLNQGGIRSIDAVKGNLYASVNIGQNSVTGVRKVDISITQVKIEQ